MDKKDLLNKRFPVLDKGWVELQDVMGDDLAIVNAARTSFLGESKGSESDKKLLHYLYKNRHTTPFEQVEFKFRVRAPLVVWWQWVRHRTWNFNAQSGRYTEFEESDFYIPSEWREQSNNNKQCSDGLLSKSMSKQYSERLTGICMSEYRMYQQDINDGISREQARLFLPAFGIYYTWVCKVDARNLMHFLELRMHEHAQYEIRMYAESIYENIFKAILPWTDEAFQKYTLDV
jgi:thymidylate synthase (FAD)